MPLLVGFCFKAAREGIVEAQRKRFELRISDEDRDRLRTLAQHQATTESGAIRALIRGINVKDIDETREVKEEAAA